MDAGKDVYGVSVPLAAGVLTAAFFLSEMGNASGWRHIVAGASQLILCVMILLGVRYRTRSPIYVLPLCFILGFFTFASRSLFSFQIDVHHYFPLIKAGLSASVDAIPFADSRNNALVKALILGDRQDLSQSVVAAFRDAGAAHMLALSGMHLGIIYLVLGKILSLFGGGRGVRTVRSLCMIAVTGLYTMLTGASPSLVRAWLFIALNETSLMLERKQSPQHILCAALTIHLLIRPESVSGIGFQLSYLAMVGIVFVWPLVRSWYPDADDGSRSSVGCRVWDAASLSICCQMFTAPLTLLYFGTFPKYFLVTNLFAAPLMTFAMLSSLLSILLSLCGWTLPFATACCELPLSLLRRLLELIASMN